MFTTFLWGVSGLWWFEIVWHLDSALNAFLLLWEIAHPDACAIHRSHARTVGHTKSSHLS